MFRRALAGYCLPLMLLMAAPATASRHLMVITELCSGIGGNPAYQFIELQTTAPGQNFTAGGQILARDADGANERVVFTFPANFGSGAAGERILICTQPFADLPGAPAADFIFPGGLPVGSGQIILFPDEGSDALAFGDYTGPAESGGVGTAPANDGYGNLTLQRTGSSGNDGLDYALAANAPRNFAGQSGTVAIPANEALPRMTVDLTTITSGLDAPVGLAVPGDGSGRLFVFEQTGRVKIIDTQNNNQVAPTPFLDVSAKLAPRTPFNFDERGLIGLAFHPGYATNGKFYVFYSAPWPSPPPDDGSGNYFPTRSTVAEFQASGNPDVASTASERVLLTIDKMQFNHNGGQLAFGPDGLLYIGVGDGGNANDEGTDHNPLIGNAQDTTTLKGKILRIDVDGTSGSLPYRIPATNPFTTGGGRPEIYALGMRNPFRFGFDDQGAGATGSFILPDVGQNMFEEINLARFPGENFGWRAREAAHCFDPNNPGSPPAQCETSGLTDPIAEYGHPGGTEPIQGLAVIGGFVYRGALNPALRGIYLFADFDQAFTGTRGRLMAMNFAGAFPGNPPIPISRVFVDGNQLDVGGLVNSIGRDEDGELYVVGQVGIGFPNPPTGFVKKVVNARVIQASAARGWPAYR